jgi:hypothetical protein
MTVAFPVILGTVSTNMSETAVRPRIPSQLVTFGPSLVVSFLIADTFYKFGSFSREFIAWGATFAVLYYAQKAVVGLFSVKQAGQTREAGK